MSVIGSNILAGASGQGGGYNLTKSLRFRSSASAYLNRTPATATNRQTWTWSGWVKRGQLGIANAGLFGALSGSESFDLVYEGNFGATADSLRFVYYNGSALNGNLVTTALYRDTSAWYHIVAVWNTTDATSSNRMRLYVNGNEITAFSTSSYPTQNTSALINNTVAHTLGRYYNTTSYFDGYLAEVNFIDGQALTPYSFGETSTSTGVWIPKKYTGTYGTNGFYLPFTNTTSTSTLGNDFSGNSNTWTVNGISLTAGSTYDSMNDVPTLTSATQANYCVLNPLTNVGIGTVSNGNLQLVTSTNSRAMTGSMALSSTGQYYFEITATDYTTGGGTFFGVVNQEFLTGAPSNGTFLAVLTYSASYQNGTTTDTNNLTGTDVTNDGDIWCFAIDVPNNKFWVGRSRSGTLVWADGVTPAVNGSGATTISLPTGTLYPLAYRGGSFNETYDFNFGQQPFAHTPPTGFVALNTFNLPAPPSGIGVTASELANEYFDATLYTGNSGTQSITNSGSMQPDFVWLKSRSNALDHGLFDSVRGVQNVLASNGTGAANYGGTGELTAFNSNGFTLVNSGSYQTNQSGYTYVAWQWRASNATAVTNTAGSITSTVSANTTAGFSVVTYTGTGANATVGHGLGVAPSMIMVKNRDSGAIGGAVYHTSMGATKYLKLFQTTTGSDGEATDNTAWNGSSPTFDPSVFSVGSLNRTNSSQQMVAYCFAPIAGYSAFGSYTGNGSTDGTFVYLGFRPRFVMFKNSTQGSQWILLDTARNTYNLANAYLEPNTPDTENTANTVLDILSNGFKLRNGGGTDYNESNNIYVYACFAENPFKYANAR